MTALIAQPLAPLPGMEHLAGRRYQGKPPRALRRRLRTPAQISISQWAELYRRVTEIDSSPGPWRNELVPHLVKIMDTISQPHVREVWICAPERSGKTQVLINTACWAVDQGSRSGNIFWLMPTETDARKALGERIIPVFRAKDSHGRPGRIARYLSDYADDTTRGMVRFNHGIRLFPAWSNSPASMASYFGRINIADECDKFTERTSEGSDPITLFRKRARDDRGRSKYIYASTPAGRYIHAGTQDADQLWRYHLRCPDCDAVVLPGAQHLSIPADAKASDYTIRGVHLACPACGVLWDEQARAAAYRSGRWVAVHGGELLRPESVGFHMSAFVLPLVPLSEIAGAYLRAKTGDLAAKIAWANGYEATDYQEEIAEKPQLATLIERRESYAPVVPMDAAVLTAGVDVQADRLEVEVVAWGEAAQSWGMDYVRFYGDTLLPDVWGQLDAYLLQPWRHESGTALTIRSAFVDAGYRSHIVYRWVQPRHGRGIYAVKGASKHDAREISGPTAVRVGAVKAAQYLLGTQRLKTQMFGYLALDQPGPGYCHVPDQYPPEWFDMLQSEHIVTRTAGTSVVKLWEKTSSNARNEAIDLRTYALAAFLALRIDLKAEVRALRESANSAHAIPQPAPTAAPTARRELPSWFSRR